MRKKTGIVGGLKYEKSFWVKKVFYGDVHYCVIKEREGDRGMTSHSLEFLKQVWDHRMIGDVKYAYITKETDIGRGHLVLVDAADNELHLTGCGAGYSGTGARGTVEVLETLGFEIDLLNLVFRNETFNLKHPKFGVYQEE